MKDKYKTILVLISLLAVVNILQTNRIENLEDKIARQKQDIVELQHEVDIIDEYINSMVE